MPAAVTFVTGRGGAGKSRLLHSRILSLRPAPCTLIVPEQFTFEAERQLSESLHGGLMGVEVYSFTSLASRVLQAAGERAVFLSAQGRSMVLRRATEECRDRLTAFQGVCDRPGFCKSLDALFSLCKRSELTPEAMARAAGDMPEDLLGRKLRDLALLYEKSEAALAGKYLRDTDAIADLSLHIPDSFLAGQDVFIDNCDIWAEQIYSAVDALFGAARTVTVCVRADMAANCRDKQVFANEYRAYARLRRLAEDRGCPMEEIRLPLPNAPWGGTRHENPALAHLEREAFAEPFQPYVGAPEGIELCTCTDIPAEAEAVADAVEAAAKGGMRYRDMAVVACDLPAYVNAVERVFRRRGIPYFTDAKHPLGRCALPRLLLSALRCCTLGNRPGDVLSLCKTGLAGVDRDGAEEFENYVLSRGVRGNAFLRPFAGEDTPAGAEAARQALMEPLTALREGLKAAPAAAGKTEALYAYMDGLGVRERTEELCVSLREAGRLGLMEENRQVYELLMELFSQLHAIMGDAKVSAARFLALFQEGVDAYDVGVIPTTADQVLFGSLDRTRARSVRALFLLGAAEGAFPRGARDDGMIDDGELARMRELGLSTWDDTAVHAAANRMDAYLALSKPSERLYISCAGAQDASPSALMDRIRALFPGLPSAASAPGVARLPEALRLWADGGPAPDAAILRCYTELYPARAALLTQALFPPAEGKLPEAAALFGAAGSASRLEAYNACPFRHYARYGLKALPRREYRERPADEGGFCHEALSAYVRALEGRDAAALGRADTDAMLDAILPALLQSHNGGVLLSSGRMKARAARLIRRVKATAWAVTQQLSAGRFRVLGSEVGFGGPGELPALELELANNRRYRLSGSIDRLDGFTEAGAAYYRVVDYKSGDTAFDFGSLYEGLRLQLPLYIAAAVTADATAAGMYYFNMDDPVAEEGEPLEQALIRQFQLKGITLQDPVVELATDEAHIGVLPPRSGRVPPDVMGRVIRHAAKKSAQTAGRMLSGEAGATPYRQGQRTPCDWCEYKSLCRFDRKRPECAYRTVNAMDAQAFMERTEEP